MTDVTNHRHSDRQSGRFCQGCGAELPPKTWKGRDRKWCSDRCRKDTMYGRSCIDCGAPLSTSDGNGPNAPVRCYACNGLANPRTAGRIEKVLEMVHLRNEEHLTNLQIAERMNISAKTVNSELHRMRVLGFHVDPAPYNNRRVGQARVNDEPGEKLSRELARRGITPQTIEEVTAECLSR